jgi:4-hydroxy-3-polyprenylbenzoate decarboxylase
MILAVRIARSRPSGKGKRADFVPYSEQNGIPRGKHSVKAIVGISGASGAIYGVRLLERLACRNDVEIHLILTKSGEKTLFLETGKLAADVRKLAHFWHPLEDIGSRLASGSSAADAMVIAPCSIHTMSAIAAGLSSNLLIRAADVILKERRKLILLVRESPFHLGHLRNMTALAEMGAVIAPPVPAFYHHPETVMDIVDHSVDRVLDLLGVPDPAVRRWEGVSK